MSTPNENLKQIKNKNKIVQKKKDFPFETHTDVNFRKGQAFKPLIVILGPTASGKSETALKIAKKFNGEIVSADSRQIYRGMDIGTAKPNIFSNNNRIKSNESRIYSRVIRDNSRVIREIHGVPHYLIDVVNPDEEFSVAEYKKLAVKTIKDIQKRGKLPFLVGGAALYLYAVIDNLDFPQVPPSGKLREKLEKKPTERLFKIYKKLDPEGAKFIDKNNKRRLIRAIEVCKATGKPFWEQRKKKKPLFDALELGLKVKKEKLKERISKRVEKMIESGLEQEARNLVKKYGWNIPALNTIGYQEWRGFFEKKIGVGEVENLMTSHTLQFSKRQMVWFKRDKRIKWIKSKKESEKLIKKFLEIERDQKIEDIEILGKNLRRHPIILFR